MSETMDDANDDPHNRIATDVSDVDASDLTESPEQDAYVGFIYLPNNHAIRQVANELADELFDTLEEKEQFTSNIGGNLFEMEVEQTDLTLREAAAYILSRNDSLTWDEASEVLEISPGTFRGKVSNEVASKLDRARFTMRFVDEYERSEIEDHYENLEG